MQAMDELFLKNINKTKCEYRIQNKKHKSAETQRNIYKQKKINKLTTSTMLVLLNRVSQTWNCNKARDIKFEITGIREINCSIIFFYMKH